MEGEQERLERMYAELGEEHLRDLYDDRDTLTLDGQLALARVLATRGLAPAPPAETTHQTAAVHGQELESGFTPGIPGVIPSGAETMERALEHGGERREGMISLITFFDGHELTRACEALDAENFDFALEGLERDALSGAPTSFGLWVEEADRTAAEDVLRRTMGLFPASESEGQPVVYDEEPMTLGDFETAAEADRVRTQLAQASIESTVSTEVRGNGETWHTVQVKGTDLERGLALVGAGL